jgi:hypothetical protein
MLACDLADFEFDDTTLISTDSLQGRYNIEVSELLFRVYEVTFCILVAV